MVLDFSKLTTQELEAYFGEGDLRHSAGYSNYELEFKFQNKQHFKNRLVSLLTRGGIDRPMNILELGGARGHRARHALRAVESIQSWEIIDIYDSPLKRTHAELVYTIGDANELLAGTQLYEDDSKDVVLSFRFLECIPESKLPDLIININRVAKHKQIHIIGTENNPDYYSGRNLSWWAEQGFSSGSLLISHKDFQRGEFENRVVV